LRYKSHSDWHFRHISRPSNNDATSAAAREEDFTVTEFLNDTRGADAAAVNSDASAAPAASGDAQRTEAPSADAGRDKPAPAGSPAVSGGAVLTGARQQLQTLNAQLANARDALHRCAEPVRRLRHLLDDLALAEQDLNSQRSRYDATVGEWIASGCRSDRPPVPANLRATLFGIGCLCLFFVVAGGYFRALSAFGAVLTTSLGLAVALFFDLQGSKEMTTITTEYTFDRTVPQIRQWMYARSLGERYATEVVANYSALRAYPSVFEGDP
jgi:hypothetical protein